MTCLVTKPEVCRTALAGFVGLVFISPFVEKDKAVDGVPNRLAALLL